jgi:high-affinity Fe2+/Pb2+ permease
VCGDNISALFSYERHTTSDTKTKIIAGLALTVAFALGVLVVVFFLAITACD